MLDMYVPFGDTHSFVIIIYRRLHKDIGRYMF